MAERELVRLPQGLWGFKSGGLSGALVKEVLHPRSYESHDPLLDIPKAREIIGLLKKGTFEVNCKDEIHDDAKVLGGRFVLDIKIAETKEPVYKSRFVVQTHTDTEKKMIIHSAKTISQHSVRVLIALAAVYGFSIWSQDISQA